MSCEGKGSVSAVREFFEADGGRKLNNTEMLTVKSKGIAELAEMMREWCHKERAV